MRCLAYINDPKHPGAVAQVCQNAATRRIRVIVDGRPFSAARPYCDEHAPNVTHTTNADLVVVPL